MFFKSVNAVDMGNTALRAEANRSLEGTQIHFIFEYPWNLVYWQNATCVSLKNQPVKK